MEALERAEMMLVPARFQGSREGGACPPRDGGNAGVIRGYQPSKSHH